MLPEVKAGVLPFAAQSPRWIPAEQSRLPHARHAETLRVDSRIDDRIRVVG